MERGVLGIRLGSRSLLLAGAVLLVSLSISPARGALPAAVDTAPAGERDFWLGDLKAMQGEDYGLKFYYQVPENPRGVAAFFHACVHSGYNYFPFSPECPDCRGLPEEMSHSVQALRLGYAVIAISSSDRQVGCWGWNNDGDAATGVLRTWLKDWGLQDLPLYGAGISSGASFALKMPRNLKFSGVVSEALGIDPNSWGMHEAVGGTYPPTVFVSMERDTDTAERIRGNVADLKSRGVPVQMIKVYPRQVYPTYFSDRNPLYINETFSKQISQGLFEIQMIDKDGTIVEDPRYTERPWMAELQAKVPGLRGSGPAGAVPRFPDQAPSDVAINGIWSLMNLAYASHEIISDYTTAAFKWFDSGAKTNFDSLLNDYTWGWPPAENFTYSLTTVGGAPVIPPPPKITNSSFAVSTLPGCAKQYTVRAGDFCFWISSSMGMELEDFMAVNMALNCTALQPGDVVCVAKAVPKPPPPPPSPSPQPPLTPPPVSAVVQTPTATPTGQTGSLNGDPTSTAAPTTPVPAGAGSSSSSSTNIAAIVGEGACLAVNLTGWTDCAAPWQAGSCGEPGKAQCLFNPHRPLCNFNAVRPACTALSSAPA